MIIQVQSRVNVSELATEATIVDKITAPLCKLAVSNEADQSISTAVVGEALRLRLEVSPAGIEKKRFLSLPLLIKMHSSRRVLDHPQKLLRCEHRDWREVHSN